MKKLEMIEKYNSKGMCIERSINGIQLPPDTEPSVQIFKNLSSVTQSFFISKEEAKERGLIKEFMPKTNEREWEKKAREQWGTLVGPKSNQFDQEVALIKILRQLELGTIARCAEVARNKKKDMRFSSTIEPHESHNRACEDIATAITSLKECVP